MTTEREAKLLATPDTTLPSLDGLLPGVTTTALVERHLDATYYDTVDLNLARWGVTLRHRLGEDGPGWTLKLPEATEGQALSRNEMRFDGKPDAVPMAVRDLVRAYTRSRPLKKVARLHTDRSPLEFRGPAGERVAELVDDRVRVFEGLRVTGSFREVEVELLTDDLQGDRLLKAAVERLVQAGCRAERPISKLVRALGERALEPPEVVAARLTHDASLGELVRQSIAHTVDAIMRPDPGVRLGEDIEDVHKFRVGTRRLRSNLRTFGPLLEPDTVRQVRDELKWLGSAVGAVRDNDVLSERMRAQSRSLPEPDTEGAGALLDRLAAHGDEARERMLSALRSRRYLALLDMLVLVACAPPFLASCAVTVDERAGDSAASYVRRPWKRLKMAVAELDDDASDAALHNVRILAKRCRYAAEAVAPVADPRATEFAQAVADVQTVLGDHQDAVVAEAWLRQTAPATPAAGITLGELIAVQRVERARLRTEWPGAWERASSKKLTSWI